MPRKSKNIVELIEYAKNYGVEDNPLIIQAIDNYNTLKEALETINKQIKAGDFTNLNKLQNVSNACDRCLKTVSDLIFRYQKTEPADDFTRWEAENDE